MLSDHSSTNRVAVRIGAANDCGLRKLETELGLRPKIKLGGQGQLDVIVDGELVFSRHRAGRYPAAAEILKTIGKS